jgi:hypothetical protein
LGQEKSTRHGRDQAHNAYGKITKTIDGDADKLRTMRKKEKKAVFIRPLCATIGKL